MTAPPIEEGTPMPFAGTLEDRILIRERNSAYADAMFLQDMDGWLACFAEDCVWRGVGLEYRGIAELEASWPAMWADLKKMAYFTEVAGIEVDGDVAKARCYSRQIMFRKDGGVGKVVGLYRDTFVRRGDTWLYSLREFEFIGAEPAPGQVLPSG
jgi:ketosteroid isomerase-like protein